jgi:hypothetical protein
MSQAQKVHAAFAPNAQRFDGVLGRIGSRKIPEKRIARAHWQETQCNPLCVSAFMERSIDDFVRRPVSAHRQKTPVSLCISLARQLGHVSGAR